MRINTPRIPFKTPIEGNLRPGVSLYFKGTVPNNANRFAINLQAQRGIVLHFNPRFRGWSGVVFNNRNRGWKREERTRQPFTRGGDFELLFTVTTEGYQVEVDGEALHLFQHRMPVQSVKALQVVGNVSMETIIIGEEGRLGKTLSIPHLRSIDGGLRVGMSVFFKGMVHDDINRFHINLKCGDGKGCDKALHFNPRFKHGEVVVFNTFRNGRWEHEERPGGMPFTKGGVFELLFIVTSEGYQVKVNDQDFHLFKHRMPVENVTAIKIAGDVSIQTIEINKAFTGEVAVCAVGPPLVAPVAPALPINQDVNPIYGSLRAGMSVYFKGTVPKDVTRFSINLHCGNKKGCDNAFHFNPRFDSNVVVFNTFCNGGWQNEERPSEMPFSKGKDFELLFIITSEGYQVNVNGTEFYLFKHRMPVEDVTAIKIFGDVSMETTNIIEGGERGMQGHLRLGKVVLPSTPHKMTIHGGLKVGMYLHFRGTVKRQINRFHINLQYGQRKGRGVALHFNPRFRCSEVVVFNTFQHGWKREERVREMPFRRGEEFELVFIVTPKGYQVNVNGRQFYMFKHRMPAKNVNVIKIAGGVSMETINIIGGGEADNEGLQGLRKMAITKIPHVGPIFGGLRTGTYMYFRGTVPNELNRFAINLQYGEMKGCDKAIHFNPRFKPSEVVVFNSFRNGSWENEERVNKMPFRMGEDFEILFIINAVGYQVIINGRQFHLFKHRMPVEQVSALKIAGDVSMKTVNMIRGVQGALQGHPRLGKMVITKIPHVGPIYGGLRPGMALFFRGKVPQDIKRFHINLQFGGMKGCDKALHFNPRFEPSEVVVFNSFRNGRWEHEERPSEMPFHRGEDFELLFIITAEGYQVNVNGRQFYLFKHRMPVEHVSTMKIAGDVSMETVNMTEAGKVGRLRHPGVGKMVVSSIPFVGPIHGCLRTGMYMYFRGTVPQDINRFHVNLQFGEKKGCDKALHFNPRFKNGEVIVFNSFLNGRWKREERVHQMPFRKGEDFELLFIVTPKGYQVLVNGRPLHLFKHRVAVEQVSTVKIAGDVTMEFINLTGGRQGLGGPEKLAVTKIPHVGPIHGGLRTGMLVFFRGTVPQDINRFHINLQYGELKGCDKAIHFNPRFKPHEVVVFNSYRSGKWEKEERVHEMPFQKGEDFELAFIVSPKGYQVIVNGRQFYLFKHRMPVEHVSALKIAGDVTIQTLNMIGGEDDDQERRPRIERMTITKIPHVGPIHRGLRKGMALHFQGTVPDDVNRFKINLQYGEKSGSDLALHFNPRFKPYGVVVFNTFRKGRWEKEERPSEMPFRKGEDFELVFVVTEHGYQVYVNGEKFYLFKHRMPVENVSALKIAGDVSMETVDMNEGEDYDIPEHPGLKEILDIPYLRPISGGLKTGASVYVKGKIPSKSHRFSINLHCGDKDGCDNALHFNPRFDSNVVVFNTFRNGRWENEERPSEMPFHRVDDFELLITATSEGYQVNVNGSEFYLFKHRMPVERVCAIKIVGDVSLHDVDIIDGDDDDELEEPEREKEENKVVPKIPNVGTIFGGLRAGMSVYFKGTVPQKSKRFSINLHCEEKDGCDNAFHFNPRFQSKVVVFNTFRNGRWENEERPSEMPFRRGEDFELLFIITSEGYQVHVNGREFYLFKHRMPVEKVRAIKIFGDVSMQTSNIIEGGQEGVQGQLSQGKMVFNTIPHKGPIYGGVRKGMYLYFRGTVHEDINRFHINLQYGEKKGSNKAIHFNPRFKPREVVVFNSFRNGRWEKEERVHEMPFRQGESFELVFIVNEKGYQVIVNGHRFYMFKHRMPVKQVSTLAIAGDVSMESLKLIGGGPGGIQGYAGRRKMLVPKIPHMGPIYGGLRTGMYVYFRGTVPQKINRFAINLQYGQMKGSDIALHFNPRFEPSEVVVFNSFRNGSWENEERPAEMPFRKGEDFELVFFVTSEGYQVNVNGRQFHLFKHRMPVEHVGALKIAGDVSMKTVNMTGGGQKGKRALPGLGKMLVTKIPHVGPVYGGLKPGMYLYFKGTVPQDIKRFAINLQYGQMKGCDKAIHFNPRFEPSEVVVFNSFRNGSWENEERPAEMPFRKGEDFELVFIITSEGYQVNVNGRQFHLFKHRMPVEQVSALKIAGDVSMQAVNVTEGGEEDKEEQPDKEEMMKIPHVRSIQGGLRTGNYLYFKGTVPQDIKRFHINLQYGETKGCDKAIHFNPRFEPSEVVVFNSYRNGSWENEERPSEMPFRRGEDFELIIFVTSEGYQVNVNGRQFYLLKHRMPVEHVSAVKIAGDVSMKTMNIVRGGPGLAQPGLGKVVVSKIPHVGPVFGGLRTGMYLYFKGSVPQDIKRFHINLQYGKMKGCDKALHFNPRFEPSEVVVFNSFRNGSWENEERPEEMPFRRGEDFELVFIITSEGYQVNVNGRQFHLFKHRMPVEQVSALKIAGDVSMETINTIMRQPRGQPGQPGLGKMAINKIPHVGPVLGGLRKGMALYFRGTIPKKINRFHINLQYGEKKGSDKAIHFNPRFKPHEVVVFNSFWNGGWQKEERVDEMPFRRGEDFELVFIVTSEGYQVNINGREFYLFKHRMPLEQVSALKVAGDVSIKTAEITEDEDDDDKQEQPEKEQEEKNVVPSIPQVGPIDGGLRPGTSLCFSGTIPEEAKRFSINLHCGDDKGCDNAFHFNPRFEPSDVVVFNTFRNGSWENEERVEDMPFQPGDSFDLVFIVTAKGFKVKINDQKFYLFKHRIPMENVTIIKIFGDVIIETANIIEGGKGRRKGRLSQGKMVVDSIPFVEHFLHGLRPGMYLYFRGTIDKDINRFHINLQNGDMKGCAKALHFNPRFQPREVVVFNTFRNGRWEKEERVQEMPFRKGESFELVFIVTAKGYQVIVNGRRFHMFKHRMPVEQVSALKIAGDVSMETIDMTEGGIQGYRGLRKMAVSKIPHVAPVLGGLRPGMYLYFRGTVPQEIKRFHINLQYGKTKGCDKAIHFNPRFEPSEVVVFNSFRNGKWQKEERPAEMPFRKGEDFELLFIITSEGYQVNVNGRQFHLFKHRMPVEHVGALKIAGDVSMKTINMIGGEGGLLPSLGKMAVTSIPHVGPVYGGLRPGMFVVFRGTVPQEVKRFHINLQYGKTKGCDKALHFNPRFEPSEVVVFNSFRNGSWENEERPEEMPFRRGEDFELVFMITSEGYQVYVNGRHFYLFKHRLPVEQVSSTKIAGDVSMKTVDMTEGGKGVPVLRAPGPVVVTTTPHVEPISGGLRPGMHLYFKGTVPQEANRFAINLQNGEIKGCDKAIHFNPRFDSNVVVFNTFRNGGWQNEERPSEMPFSKGEDFELLFIITSEGYQVMVNGRQFHFFKHRMPLEEVRTFKINGDVSIQDINMTEGGQEQPCLGKTVISKIPHVVPTYGGLRPGMYLYFKGTVPQDIKRFHINLQYGERKGSDKAIHFNPRFEPSEVVVFNSYRNGSWENEERPSEMPFHRGEDFELLFFITSEGYQVNVNGRQFHLFKHRMPVEHVTAIKIAGDVTMKTLNMVEGGQDVDGSPGQGKINVPSIPHVGPVYGGLRPGMALFFQGTIPENIKRFAINLQYGQMKGCDKVFHFNPRFEPSEVVVFNSFRNGSWENEERVNKMPFQPGENFEMAFIVTSEGYQVIVNRRRFYTFKHRMPVEQVSALKINGDVFIQSANMIEGEKVDIMEKPAEKEKPAASGEGEIKEKPAVIEEPAVCGGEGEITEKPAVIEEPAVCGGEGEIKEKPAEIDQPAVCGEGEIKERPTVIAEPESTPEELVSGDLKPGMAVYFKGTIPSEITSFTVSLRCGDAKDSDTAFHFSPRFEPSEVVVLNSFQNGSWGTEETIAEMPFRRGESFELVFHVTQEDYKVYVARRMIYSFKHRIPVEQVTSVQLTGEVSMQVANYIHIGNVAMEKQEDDDDTEGAQTVMTLPRSLKAGLSMSFQGKIPDISSRFSIDLQCGETEGCNTAFHFSPQLDTSEVVFNSFQNGSWETEERVTEMPFSKGENFLLVFMLKSDGYQVNVNARPLYMFKHRFSLDEVRALKIAGDVTIENVNIVEITEVGTDEEPEEEETIQCQAPLPGSLKMETSLTFQGTTPEETKRFSINLQCGDTEGCDIAFHFSPLFDTSEVVFNSFQNGSWEEAEKVDKMPFTKGEKFELVCIITTEGYQVNINGAEFYLFKHRVPLERVKMLQIAGDVSVPNVNIAEGATQDPSSTEQTVQADIPIRDSLKPWVTMSIEGRVPEDTNRFTINLQCGDTEGCDTAFHFSPRLDTSEVVFNSFQNGSWGAEERIAQMPFTKGENFELSYSISSDGYQINVNGHPLHFFKHRMPVEQVAVLQVIGDVALVGIHLIENAPAMTPLPSGLKMGSSLTFQGTIPSESNRFSIDLQCGEAEGSDTAFSLHAQYEPSSEVVLNSYRNGSWEAEERVAEMPFRRGEDFELVYLITPEGYQVNVNSEKFCLFKHRIPVEDVKALQIAGNVSVPVVNIVEGGAFSVEETSSFETVASSAPLVVPIPDGFKVGTTVSFQGSIPEAIPSFSISLQCGEADGSDKAFSFTAQFQPSEALLLDSFKDGSWEKEERVDEMPFRRGDGFQLTFIITSEGYQVKVNDVELHTFQHRIPLEQVTALQIIGNIDIQAINIVEAGVI